MVTAQAGITMDGLTTALAATQPAFSVAVTGPYNYSFTNTVTTTENEFFDEVVDDTSGTPAYEGTATALVDTGLVFTDCDPNGVFSIPFLDMLLG